MKTEPQPDGSTKITVEADEIIAAVQAFITIRFHPEFKGWDVVPAPVSKQTDRLEIITPAVYIAEPY